MWYLGYTWIVDNLVIVKMSNICCYPLGFTIWYQVLILTGWNFISSYPLGPLSYSRLVDNYLVRPPHCFTVCVSHHLSSHLCCLPHLIPQPLVATLSNHPKLPHDTLCVLLCNSVPSPHPSITSSIVHPQTQVSTPTVSSYCLSSAQPSRLVDNYLVYPLIVSLCEHHIIFQLIFVGCPTSYPSHLLSPITHHNLLHWHTVCLTV